MASSKGYNALVHYFLQKNCWSIHVQSCCYQGHHVIIQGSWETDVKPNRSSNPRSWVKARSHQVTFFCMEDAMRPENRKTLDDALQCKGDLLRYDKVNMSFNLLKRQDYLLLSPKGSFALHQQHTTDHGELLFSFTEGGDTAHVG